MKKFALVLIALVIALAVPATVFSWGSYYEPGNVSVGADVGSYWYGLSLAVFPYAEFTVAKFHISELPIDIGVTAKGRVALGLGLFGGGFAAGVGGYGDVHFGFRGIGIPILEQLDPFFGLGLAFDPLPYPGDAAFGFVSFEGVNYFVNPNFAVYLGSNTWIDEYYYTIGVRLKLGPGETVGQAIKNQ